ncbi:MAG: DUF167 domain-containing protein [candidate division WS1 bacterium]|jgi:uncharacterized protein (TIGR00251 family)|nr:DUF167 domain-containing protein [candidate division WS1 bacterium]
MPCAQLKIRVIPRAQRTGWGGRRGDALVVRLQAAPVKGSANQALLDFLRRELDLPASALEIAHGERGRDKLLRVQGLSQKELEQRLPH